MIYECGCGVAFPYRWQAERCRENNHPSPYIITVWAPAEEENWPYSQGGPT